MSRHGYSDDVDDTWACIRWGGAVKSSLRGRRGQDFLRDLVRALEAMPTKRLVSQVLVSPEGCCAMGAVALARGTDVSDVDPEQPEWVAEVMGISETLAREVAYQNDERWDEDTPEKRYERMLRWAKRQIIVRPEEVIEP